jgi:ribosomal protein L7/L12
MGMAEDIAQIKWAISQLGSAAELTESIDQINTKLRYDIEPKLDKALEGKTATEAAPEKSPDQMLMSIRYAIIYATTDRQIEAIRELRSVTKAGLKEAKSTVDWITARMQHMIEENQNKEAE